MIKVQQADSTLRVETGGAILTWDAECGAQLVELCLKDDLFTHPAGITGGPVADLRCTVEGEPFRCAAVPGHMELAVNTATTVRILTRTELAGGRIVVRQDYEVHEEGALFCDLSLECASDAELNWQDCGLEFAVATGTARKRRWACFTREPMYKRDYSTVHAFVGRHMAQTPADSTDRRELLPWVGLDLGWEGTRFFSNRLEFLVEDWTAFADGARDQTRTRVYTDQQQVWRLGWDFLEGSSARVRSPYRYRNRWGLLWGRARTRRGPDVDPAVRNNALGSRICHCMYPYARAGERWPWISMPIKQIPEQPPQLFRGNPEPCRVDEARDLGADTMILHQFWMRNPGSNNEPAADYQAFDPDWLRAFVGRCHDRDMRVAFYCRGTEMWSLYSDFFEEFLEADRDGLYADWNTPFCMGYVKCSPLHVSAHNYFHYTRALRARVGAGGLLIGHTGNANLVASACFDAALGGEFSVRHDQLLSDPESTAYYAQLDCMGGHLISGNLPDRIAFSSARAAAICAAFGMASHPFMEPDVSFAERIAFLKPLWDALGRLPGTVTQLHNPAYAPTRAVRAEEGTLFTCLWQADSGKALLLITNLGPEPGSGVVRVAAADLGLESQTQLQPLRIPGTFGQARVDGDCVRLENMPALAYTALLLG